MEAYTETVSLLEGLFQSGWRHLTSGKLLSSLLLLLICLASVRLVTALTGKILSRTNIDKRVQVYLRKGIRAILYILAALVLAGSLGIDVTSLIALVSVFGLAVSLAVQEILSNVAAGIELLLAKPFALGDYVATEEAEGEVAEITLTHTKLDTFGGQRVMVPNSKLAAGKIVNYTVRGIRRADHGLSVSYGCAPEAVKAACLRAVSRTPHVLPDPAPQAVLTAFGESAMEYHVRFWAETEHFWDANFASLEEIHKALAEDGIELTYKHLNVHIVEGGGRGSSAEKEADPGR